MAPHRKKYFAPDFSAGQMFYEKNAEKYNLYMIMERETLKYIE